MNFIVWIVFGAIAGFIASKLTNTDKQHGIIADIIIGIIGAFLGGFISNSLGQAGVNGFNIRSFVIAVLGAVLLLVVYKLVRRHK